MDERYLKVDGKFLFFIYKPRKFNDCATFITYWRKWAREECNADFHFVAQAIPCEKDFSFYFNNGFDAVFTNRIMNAALGQQKSILISLKNIILRFFNLPRLVSFKSVINQSYNREDTTDNLYPGIICGWDHTPRSGRKGYLFTGFNKELFKKHIENQISLVKDKTYEHRIIFLKSWNEWGEGNFMEPDFEFGKQKIEAFEEVTSSWNDL